MSEKQAKRLRQLEAHEAQQDTVLAACTALLEDHGARLEACESSANVFQRCELEVKDAALKEARQKLSRSQKRARILEETIWTWKAIAVTAIVILAAIAAGGIIL